MWQKTVKGCQVNYGVSDFKKLISAVSFFFLEGRSLGVFFFKGSTGD